MPDGSLHMSCLIYFKQVSQMLREGQTRQVSTPTREEKGETPLPLETKPVRYSLIDSLIEFSVK